MMVKYILPFICLWLSAANCISGDTDQLWEKKFSDLEKLVQDQGLTIKEQSSFIEELQVAVHRLETANLKVIFDIFIVSLMPYKLLPIGTLSSVQSHTQSRAQNHTQSRAQSRAQSSAQSRTQSHAQSCAHSCHTFIGAIVPHWRPQ
jgi:hypothetical protein